MTTTRFAPSPTGYLHIGNLRAALFNWLIARKVGGKFILRLDDTDQERSKEEYVDGIIEDLTWLGLTWDQVERQSTRLDRYAEVAERLRADGRMYEVFETPVELDLKRKKQLNMGMPPVYDRAAMKLSEEEKAKLRAERPSYWRFLLDHQRIEWKDGIIGDISIDAASVSDPVLIKADGQVLYTFASVVDDVDMGITDIVRGSDHVTNTATQIQLIEALGAEVPRFAHHSLLTGPGGEGLSKRLGALSLRDLRKDGVEPMALLSLMARLGSSDAVELRTSHQELIDGFDIGRFGTAPTKFDSEDLFPLTQRYLAALPFDAVQSHITEAGVPEALAEKFWAVVKDNIATLADLPGWWRLFSEGADPLVASEDQEFVEEAFGLLSEPPFDSDTWASWTSAVKEATGRKGRALFMPLRKAVTGREKGPEMADVMPLLQKKPSFR